jgi:hypothetical protein
MKKNFLWMSAIAAMLTLGMASCNKYDNAVPDPVIPEPPVDEEISLDLTNRVSTSAWGQGGFAGAWAAPEVTTADGRTSGMAEKYGEGAEVIAETGIIMQQTIDELPNGIYTAEIYANAFFTDGRGFESDLVDGATDVVYVFANEAKTPVVAKVGTGTTENGLYTVQAEVTDGKLTLGLGKDKAGTNWHSIQIKSLTFTGKVSAVFESLNLEKTIADFEGKKMSDEAKKALEFLKDAPQTAEGLNQVLQALVLIQLSAHSYDVIASGVIPTDNLDNWVCTNGNTFHINTWSTEGNSDGTNMTTPFVECWRNAGEGALNDGNIICLLPGLNPGEKYTVSALIRVNSEAGNQPTGATLYCGDTNTDICTTGTAFEFNAIKGVYGTFTAEGTVNQEGNLEFGVKIAGANFNWIAIKDVTIK